MATYLDLIKAEDAAAADKAAKATAAEAADKAAADATTAETAANAALGTAITTAGPNGVIDTSTGTTRVFVPGGDPAGYHVLKPLDANSATG